MDTMQMVVAIPLCFGSFVHHLWLALLCKIHTNTNEYWVDVIISSSAPPLKALESNCSEKNAKACGYQRVCQET